MRIVVETNATIARHELPQEGEIWLLVGTGMLYEMREWRLSRFECGPHRTCHRVDAPESNYGCDPTVFCACFDNDVREGHWIRVMNCPDLKRVL